MKYQIWVSVDGSESAMFVEGHEHYDFLSQDTDGNKMILKKEFEAKSDDEARNVYNKFKGYMDSWKGTDEPIRGQ